MPDGVTQVSRGYYANDIGDETDDVRTVYPLSTPAASSGSGYFYNSDACVPTEALEEKSALDLDRYICEASDCATFLQKYGLAIVKNALNEETARALHESCLEVERRIVELDPTGIGNRGTGRYSFGASSATGQMLQYPAWTECLKAPFLVPLFAKGTHVLCGAGGDFVRGRTLEYQGLHADISRVPPKLDEDIPPLVVVNFACHPVTALNGPMRIIPRELQQPGRPPNLEAEPAEWRAMRLFPLESGVAIVRDARLWHGGTPNWSSDTRFLPNLEFYSAGYARYVKETQPTSRFSDPCLPRHLFLELPHEIQALACGTVSDKPLPQACKAKLTKPQVRVPHWENVIRKIKCGESIVASRLGSVEHVTLRDMAVAWEFDVEELSLTSLRITWPLGR